MTLQALSEEVSLGGGSGLHGEGHSDAFLQAIRELQALQITPVAGAGVSTKIDIAAIRDWDHVAAVIELAAGAYTDRTANTTIANLAASGTLTVSPNAADGDTATVNGKTYTFRNTPNGKYDEVQIGGTADDSAANLSAAINAREAAVENAPAEVTATVSTNVVTVTAVTQGAAGNSINLAATGNVAASGANLANGTDTGGILIDVDTTGDALLVFWYDIPQ